VSSKSNLTDGRRRRRTRAVAGALMILAVGALGAVAWYRHQAASRNANAEADKVKVRVRVEVATAERRDLPLHLYGLGLVQGWNTVTIRSRVDGQIDKVNFEEGQMIKQGDPLLQIDPRPFQAALDQATAKKALDEAQLENSRRDLVRFKTAGTTIHSEQQINTQDALVAQQEAQIKSDQAAIDNARVQLGYTTITAPIAGRMGFRLVDRGNIVHASDQQGVAMIAQVQPIAVIFTAPEDELQRINAALQSGPLSVIALTSDGKTELDKGTVELVDNQVAAGTIRLKAKFANTNLALWPGLTIATRLQIDTLKDVVTIPEVAVQRGPSGFFAYVVENDGTAQIAHLDIIARDSGLAALKEGIEPGARVITSGIYELQPGAPVEVPNSATPNASVDSNGR
jgi:membrane fusion protein, multidrug efflux system